MLRELMPKRTKYGAHKVVIDGITFDSRREAAVYRDLKLSQAAGEISDLVVHPKVVLQPAGRDFAGRRVAPIVYVADFAYVDRSGKYWRVDVKSKATRTQAYSIKRRMLLYQDPWSGFKEIE